MAVKNPAKVPKKEITSRDVDNFGGGLFLNGEQDGGINQFVSSKDVELTIGGYLTERKSLQKWLPDTIGSVHQIFPALVPAAPPLASPTVLTNFVADSGKIRWIVEGQSSWTDCGGDNVIAMNGGGKVTFLRVLDVLLILNGANGDRLAYVDLATKNVVRYNAVADPSSALSAAPTGLTTGSYNIYFAYNFNGAVGMTLLSPILTQSINKPRDSWKADGSEYLTLTRPSGNPAGAKSWNLWIALASSGGSIQPSDMLMVAGGLDLNTLSVVDNGTLAIDISRGTAPEDNSTAGPRVTYGYETDGRPVLYGDVDAPYNIWIGGDGEYALELSPAHGGYRAEPSKGTNYYPASVIGFRNGQGIPSLTILFTNTQGKAKQATLEQQTINYGNQSFVVWGTTEQNYGTAGVSSPYAVVNYNGALNFPTLDGMMSMDTTPQLQNVLETLRIGDDVLDLFKSVNTDALPEIVGDAWENKLYYIVPAYGFTNPNIIAVRDLNNNGAWYTLDIPAQWIGTVSPPKSPAFVYICQGNKILKLLDSFGSADFKGGAAEPFSTNARGTLIGMTDNRTGYKTVVQAMFYIVDFIGEMTIGVTYRNREGRMVTKKKTLQGPKYVQSSSGGWSDNEYVWSGAAAPAQWDSVAQIDDASSVLERETDWYPLAINDLVREAQWWIETPKGFNSFKLRQVSYEGENIGVKADLR